MKKEGLWRIVDGKKAVVVVALVALVKALSKALVESSFGMIRRTPSKLGG